MEIQDDCYKCLTNQLSNFMKRWNISQEITTKTVEDFNLILTSKEHQDKSPPEISTYFYKILTNFTNIQDFFVDEKYQSTIFAKQLMPIMYELLEKSDYPFLDKVKIAINGNIIDYGADKDFNMEKAKNHFAKALDLPINIDTVKKLEEKMQNAKSIFYVMDNCGEAVFDRLLIEDFKDKITIGVRGKPILNDLTRKELEISGLADLKVIDTGDMTPGVSLRFSSKEFLDAMYSSDFIIAKGQGNYETLNQISHPIFHLLCVKCQVISKLTGTPKGSPLVLARNI